MNFMKTVEKVKEIKDEEIISGNDTQPFFPQSISTINTNQSINRQVRLY